MFIQFYTMSGVSVAAVKITIKNSIGIFVITGKDKAEILNKAFRELEDKINLVKEAPEEIGQKQLILSPYFA